MCFFFESVLITVATHTQVIKITLIKDVEYQ